MPFDDILAYTWLADVHCPICTRKAHEEGKLRRMPDHPHAQPGVDREDLPYDLGDREGNLIHPIFRLGAEQREVCGDCHATIPGTEHLPPAGEEPTPPRAST